MVYQYSAYTLDKKVVRGTIDAESESMAEAALYRAGYHRVLNLREAGHGIDLRRWLPSLFAVKARDVVDFSRQLALLIDSGITILTALQLLEKQDPSSALQEVIGGLARKIREGSPYSQALARFPEVFPDTYCQIIRASEFSGNLGLALRQAADYLEAEAASIEKVRSALAYPVLVLCLAFGVVILLTLVALPPLVRLYDSLGGQLPLLTRVLLAFGGYLMDFKFYIMAALALLIIALAVYIRQPSGKAALDGLALKLPVIGGVVIQRSMSRFCLITSMMLKAGLPLAQIMSVVGGAVANTVIRRALEDVRVKLVQGMGLSQPMAACPLFPRLLVEMIVVGETAGTLDTNLATMAELYQQRTEQRIRKATAMIEPALIIAVGLVVVVIALSMITPLYSILRSML